MLARKLVFVSLIFAFIAVLACTKKQPLSNDKVLAIVNGMQLHESALNEMYEHTKLRFEHAGKKISRPLESRIKRRIFDTMVEDALFHQYAQKNGLKVDENEIADLVGRYEQKLIAREPYRKLLKSEKNLTNDLERQVVNRLLRDKALKKMAGKIRVTDEEVREYYEKHKSQFERPAEVVAETLRLSNKTLAEKIAKSAAELGTLRKAIHKQKGARKLLKGLKQDIFQKRNLETDIQKALFSAKKGDVVGPIKSENGLLLARVVRLNPAIHNALADAKKSIRNHLLAEKQADASRGSLSEMKKMAKLQILDSRFKTVTSEN